MSSSAAAPSIDPASIRPDRARLAAARVLVVGDAMLDRYWFGGVERISPEAPVPVVHVQRTEERLGGAANAAVNVQGIGARPTLLTVIGDDEPGRALRALLDKQGVETLLGHDPGLSTIVKLRVVGRSQQLIRIDFESRPDHEVLAQMQGAFERAVAEHDVVLFSDYGKGGLAHITQMIERAHAAGKAVFVDPKGDHYQRYAGATVLTPNRAELAHAMGAWQDEAELAERAQAFRHQLRLDALLLTRAEEGMTLFDDQGALHVAAEARQVFDVTGAGDTVIATLAAMVASGLTLRQAVPIANRAAGIVVSRFGTAHARFEEVFP
jgi:rfaE bifunctional protein kinase chain/domain